jgi:hypothetical protein
VRTITFYTRDGCELCAESRDVLQKARYGDLIPVLELNGVELPLAMGRRAIDSFLDRVLARLA